MAFRLDPDRPVRASVQDVARDQLEGTLRLLAQSGSFRSGGASTPWKSRAIRHQRRFRSCRGSRYISRS